MNKKATKGMIKKTKKSGQSLAEYTLVLALTAIAVVILVEKIGDDAASASDNMPGRMTEQGVASVSSTIAGF